MTATIPPVLAVLRPGGAAELAPLEQPLLRADDAAASRGDGAFETMHVRPDGVWLLEDHLDRLAGSAAALSLNLPPREQLEAVVGTAVNGWRERGATEEASVPTGGEAEVTEARVAEAGVKLICSRGPEYAPELGPTTYALAFGISERLIAQRRTGLALQSLSFGYPADERARAPWLLPGAKTLSYAVNMAALRQAEASGFDDVLLISSDGYVLEGPTSGVVWAVGDRLYTVPTETGILASTTVGYLFDNAHRLGLSTHRQLITRQELPNVDGVWLCSSVRGIVEVTSLDGQKLPSSHLTARLNELLGFSRGS
ncbi:MAG: aminotransferase class IV [Mycobacteriales bacterium]